MRATMTKRRIVILLAIVVAITAATLFTIELRRRRDLYWYDVSQDYRFTFGPHVSSTPVDISPGGFVFPATDAPWDTALVRIRVDGRWTSRWFEPSITIGDGADSTVRKTSSAVGWMSVPCRKR
jgi:hypothetical protein